MGTMRKLARTVAANQSYKKSGTTDMFGYYFKKIWREKAGHPEGTGPPKSRGAAESRTDGGAVSSWSRAA